MVGRLLKFDLKDGWAPLCEFLDRPVPGEDTPFPRAKESKALSEKIGLIARRGVVNALKRNVNLIMYVLFLLAVPALAWWLEFL